MSTTAIYRKADYHKCGIAKTSVERCLPTLYRQAEAARLPQNGIFVHWELAAKLVDDNPTFQDLRRWDLDTAETFGLKWCCANHAC
jgi:hypothetical protein